MLRESISTPDNDKQLFIKIPDEIILIMQWKTMNPSTYSSPIYKSSLGNGLAEHKSPRVKLSCAQYHDNQVTEHLNTSCKLCTC